MTNFTPKIITKFRNPVVVVIFSQLIQAAAAFLVGPSKFFKMQDSIYYTIAGLFLTGVFSPLIIVPSYFILVDVLEKRADKHFNPDEINNIVSGIYNASYAIGGMTGPIFGDYVTQLTNYHTTNDL